MISWEAASGRTAAWTTRLSKPDPGPDGALRRQCRGVRDGRREDRHAHASLDRDVQERVVRLAPGNGLGQEPPLVPPLHEQVGHSRSVHDEPEDRLRKPGVALDTRVPDGHGPVHDLARAQSHEPRLGAGFGPAPVREEGR